MKYYNNLMYRLDIGMGGVLKGVGAMFFNYDQTLHQGHQKISDTGWKISDNQAF